LKTFCDKWSYNHLLKETSISKRLWSIVINSYICKYHLSYFYKQNRNFEDLNQNYPHQASKPIKMKILIKDQQRSNVSQIKVATVIFQTYKVFKLKMKNTSQIYNSFYHRVILYVLCRCACNPSHCELHSVNLNCAL